MSQVKVVRGETQYVVTMNEDQALVIVALLGALRGCELSDGLYYELRGVMDQCRLEKLSYIIVRDDTYRSTTAKYIIGDES